MITTRGLLTCWKAIQNIFILVYFITVRNKAVLRSVTMTGIRLIIEPNLSSKAELNDTGNILISKLIRVKVQQSIITSTV